MSDQLRDAMTRIAERAEPVAAPDPTLWSRARRARRRSDVVTACAVGAAVFALVAGLGILVQPHPDPPDPSPTGRPGIPTIVRGLFGDGDLRIEKDLAVGPASVAIANPTGAFVVTAEDGIYHRLDLPGFDASVYDDPEVRRTGMVGLSLSPDGTRLAFGFHGALPEESGQEHGFVPSGVRILDLQTGSVETISGDPPLPSEYTYIIDAQDFQWAVVPYGIRWSPDGRYLVYDLVWRVASTAGEADTLTRSALEGAYSGGDMTSAPMIVDTQGDADFFVRNIGSYVNWWNGWPSAISDSGTVATASTWLQFVRRGTREAGWELTDNPQEPYSIGLVRDDRAILETQRPSSHLLAVDLRTGTRERLELPLTPVQVDLVGWINHDHVLARVAQGSEQNLIVFDLSDAEVETDLVAPFDDEGTDSTFSFATDFATVRHPTVDFDAAAADDSREDAADAAAPRAGDGPLGADDGGDGPAPVWLVGGLVGGLAAAAAAVLVLRRRIRVD